MTEFGVCICAPVPRDGDMSRDNDGIFVDRFRMGAIHTCRLALSMQSALFL